MRVTALYVKSEKLKVKSEKKSAVRADARA
jgi:hypothetical protein